MTDELRSPAPLDRSDAVNLARNLSGAKALVSERGIKCLADAVLRMDAALRDQASYDARILELGMERNELERKLAESAPQLCADCGCEADCVQWGCTKRYDEVRNKALEDVFRWLDNNTTFYNVDADWPVDGHNIPVLAQVSERIWYHATDDQKSYPFSEVIKRALAAQSSAQINAAPQSAEDQDFGGFAEANALTEEAVSAPCVVAAPQETEWWKSQPTEEKLLLMTQARDSLLAEVARMRPDAERYRWLRSYCYEGESDWWGNLGDKLDAGFDADIDENRKRDDERPSEPSVDGPSAGMCNDFLGKPGHYK